MKRLAVLVLASCFALPACSAKNDAEQAPAADPAAAEIAAVDVTDTDIVVLAQTDGPAPVAARPPVSDEPAGEGSDPAPGGVADADPTIVTAQAARVDVSAPADRPDIVEGRHYRLLTPAQPTSSSPDQIEVAELFMYMCPHCYSFEPFIDQFLADKPSYVSFVRIPASFNKIARVHAKGFYAADTLGVLEDVHIDFFRAYHTENKRLADDKAIVDFLATKGVAREEAEKAMKSFVVDTKLRQADNLVRRYRIDSVPTLVINGKYVTSGAMAGSMDKLEDIVDYLVAKEAAAM